VDDIRQAKINNRAGAARTTREDADLEQIIIETIGRRIHPKHVIGPTTWVEIILRGDKQFANCYERERDERNKYS
jgi:hypothetical protein